MKLLRNILIVLTAVSGFSSLAQGQSFKMSYAEKASADYTKATVEAKKVQTAIAEFLSDTTQENLDNAKAIWIEARKVYSVTEIYRFYGGPIDSEEGPEGLLNAWPLDEAYIDYVKGAPDAGIINQVVEYPTISKELLIELNEKDGEKNISTGWHAIEFLLWGQDFNDNGPGNRALKDFIVGSGKNAERRRQYLSIVSELLVEHLQTVADAWDQKVSTSYFNSFVALSDKETLTNAFTSLVSMSGDELAIERMFVAYDTQFQEDEHSCFSDTTHFDIYFNFVGVKEIWQVVESNTDVMVKNPVLVEQINSDLTALENMYAGFKGPFDQAIFEEEGRQQILDIVNGLQGLSEKFLLAAEELEISI